MRSAIMGAGKQSPPPSCSAVRGRACFSYIRTCIRFLSTSTNSHGTVAFAYPDANTSRGRIHVDVLALSSLPAPTPR